MLEFRGNLTDRQRERERERGGGKQDEDNRVKQGEAAGGGRTLNPPEPESAPS